MLTINRGVNHASGQICAESFRSIDHRGKRSTTSEFYSIAQFIYSTDVLYNLTVTTTENRVECMIESLLFPEYILYISIDRIDDIIYHARLYVMICYSLYVTCILPVFRYVCLNKHHDIHVYTVHIHIVLSGQKIGKARMCCVGCYTT